MPPGATIHLSLEEHIANLQKAGIDWKPPTGSKEVEEATSPASLSVSWDPDRNKQQNVLKKFPEKAEETMKTDEAHWSEESESEMMGRGNASGPKTTTRAIQRVEPNTLSEQAEARLKEEAFKDLGLDQGQKADKHESLTSWKFLVRYAELYVGKANFPIVWPYFDSKVILDNQHWDLFYLYDPKNLEDDPILFVPVCQVEAYLRFINRKEGLALTIPKGNEHKFAIQFGSLRTQQPRYLGSTWGPGSLKQLVGTMPLPNPEDEYAADAYENERDDFASLLIGIRESWVLTKSRGKDREKSKKKAQERKALHKEWGRMTKRVQRYLGLREATTAVGSHADFTGQVLPSHSLNLDVNRPAPFNLEKEVVFVCFDVECYEFNHNIITEVGFAILDTKDLCGVAPGEGAEGWFELIKAVHFRIMDYKHLRNSKYVTGCPGKFQFGNSKFVGMESIQKRCIEILVPKDDVSGKPRNIVIVGHDVEMDVKLIYSVDVDIHQLPGLVDIADSQRMHQHYQKVINGQKLGTVLTDLGIKHSFLHNGGNDAVYTLQSLLALALRRRQYSLAQQLKAVTRDPSIPKPPRKDEEAGWSTGGEQSDGGPAPRLIDPNAEVKGSVGGVNWGLPDMQLPKTAQ